MNTLYKLIKQKNTLLFFATCIALSSITLQCDSCDAAKEEGNTVAMNLEGAPEIKGSEVATLTLQKTAGATILGDVVFTITNPESFVTEGGKALTANMRLNEFLGKEAEEKMEDAKIELKVKASPKTIADNKDITLKIAVGNNTDTAAYVSEKDVVTWKAAPLTAAITVTVTPDIISSTSPASTITIQKTGTASITYGEVLVTLDSAVSNADHFQAKYGTGAEQGFAFVFGGGTPIFLHNWLSVLGATINATDNIPDTPIDIIVTAIAGTVVDGSKITFSVGKTGAPDLYSGGTKVITWQADPIIMTLTGDLNKEITGNDEQELNLTITKTSGKITYGAIRMKLANLTSFEVKSAGGSVLDLTKPVHEILGKNATDEIPNGPENLIIKVKANDATKAAKNNETLKLSITNFDGSVTYVAEKDVVTWKAESVKISLDVSVVAHPNNHHHAKATMNFKKTNGNIKFSQAKIYFNPEDSFTWYHKREKKEKPFTAFTTLAELLNKGDDEIMDGADYAFTLKVKASDKTLNENQNVTLQCSLGNDIDHALYAGLKTFAKWDPDNELKTQVDNITEIKNNPIVQEDELLNGLNTLIAIFQKIETDEAKKNQKIKECTDITTPLGKFKALGEINGSNVLTAINLLNEIVYQSGDFIALTEHFKDKNEAALKAHEVTLKNIYMNMQDGISKWKNRTALKWYQEKDEVLAMLITLSMYLQQLQVPTP